MKQPPPPPPYRPPMPITQRTPIGINLSTGEPVYNAGSKQSAPLCYWITGTIVRPSVSNVNLHMFHLTHMNNVLGEFDTHKN